MRYVIAVSGPIAVGKSAVISALEATIGAKRVSTRKLIQSLREVPSERKPLQEAGEDLDRTSDGKWVADSVAREVSESSDDEIVIVDSVRIAKQVTHLRDRFGCRLFHVHLTASDEELHRRFQKRKDDKDPAVADFATYGEARANATEAQIESLAAGADEVVLTDGLLPDSVATLAVRRLRLLQVPIVPLVDVVVGGQYGSEGKGNICDFIADDYDVLVRVGGPNAGHRVKSPPYDYVHLPSGTGGNPRAKLLIGAGATLDIAQVTKEINELGITPERLSIDPQAIVIEDSDRRLETDLAQSIGSTQKGVGIATARKIVNRGERTLLGSPVQLVKHLVEKDLSLRPFVRPVWLELERAYTARHRILLEGTQGTDLSIHHGSYPHVTSRETTASGCLADAGISPRRVDRVYMVTRTYPIRVGGKSGGMGIEINCETIALRSGGSAERIKATEVGTRSGKNRRIGEFSWEQVRRASQLNGATDIVLTFADYIDANNERAKTFDDLSDSTKQFIAKVELVTGIPVSLIAVGFGRDKVIDRRDHRGQRRHVV